MKAHIILLSLVLTQAANAQSFVLYEFDLRVTSNTTLGTGLGGDLLLLPVGAEGTISILVNDDQSLFPPTFPGNEQAYAIESIALSVNGVSAGGLASAYPSTSDFSSLAIINNFTFIDSITNDIFSPGLFFDHPDIALAFFSLGQSGTLSNQPALIQSTDLPLALDLSLADNKRLTLNAAAGTNLRVIFELTDVTITVVPAPASSAALALGALTSARRRR